MRQTIARWRNRWGLTRRVARLEQEMQENRALQRRVAELTDVIVELLVPAMDRDDARVRAALERLDLTTPDPKRAAQPDL